MKNLILAFAITLIAAYTNAAILPGTYAGSIKYSVGSKGKTYKKRNVTIYIQPDQAGVTDLAYALIIDDSERQASLYRVEELPDGNQLWIQFYQGQNNVLKVNDLALPDFNGNFISGGNNPRLILKPTEQRIRCGEREIDVSLLTNSKWSPPPRWMPLPRESMSFKMSNGTYSTYDGTTFKGDLQLGDITNHGVLHLTDVLPNVATLRKSVVDQKTLSGYRQERQIMGFVTNIGSRKNNLLFVGLPVGARQCSFAAQLLRNE